LVWFVFPIFQAKSELLNKMVESFLFESTVEKNNNLFKLKIKSCFQNASKLERIK
jgi:hypothetical protein